MPTPTPLPSMPPEPTKSTVFPLLVTVEVAAEMLGIGRTRMFDLIKSGEVSSVLIGRSRRVPIEALRGYVAALTAAAASSDDRAA